MFVEAWAETDVGLQRVANEDCMYVDPDDGIILILDGMGGHQAGEVASKLAMETMSTFYKENSNVDPADPEVFDDYDKHFTFHANLLRQAVFAANRVVLDRSREEATLVGMGSTVAGIAIQEFAVSAINVGDTRIYLIRDGTIEQVSRDHTLAEDQVERGVMTRKEAGDSQLRHVLSSVLGVDNRVRVHMDEMSIYPDDLLLLCSDGLTAVMADEEILQQVSKDRPGPEMLRRMITEVNARGGPDNTTIALVRFAG